MTERIARLRRVSRPWDRGADEGKKINLGEDFQYLRAFREA
jgi:hypothetical protein